MESFTLGLMRGDGAPLYRQLYRHIVEEIASGGLAAGEKLPSKAPPAADLRVSVSTVETAYQMLVAEGYIAARAKSGFTVCRIEKLDAPVRPAPAAPPEPPAKRWAYDLARAVDTALFPFKTWARIQRETVTAHPELLNHGSRQGDASLRAAIAKYLHAYRGVVCAPEQIVVGAGIEYLVGLLARLFCASTFAVENPGYPRTAQVLRNNGVRTVFVPVDGDGMTLDALQAGGAQLAYVTPSHQFPTGATMPIARRTELLRWAGAAPGRYVVEDDYDSEFRYDTRPIPSLQGLDQAGRVIYVSTFSKSMAPSMRIGYMVLPVPVLEMYRAEYGVYSSTVSRFEQQTLCRFMEEGICAASEPPARRLPRLPGRAAGGAVRRFRPGWRGGAGQPHRAAPAGRGAQRHDGTGAGGGGGAGRRACERPFRLLYGAPGGLSARHRGAGLFRYGREGAAGRCGRAALRVGARPSNKNKPSFPPDFVSGETAVCSFVSVRFRCLRAERRPSAGALCASASGAAGAGVFPAAQGWFVSGSVTVALNRSPSTVMENVPALQFGKALGNGKAQAAALGVAGTVARTKRSVISSALKSSSVAEMFLNTTCAPCSCGISVI